jgi:hypothetical protein
MEVDLRDVAWNRAEAELKRVWAAGRGGEIGVLADWIELCGHLLHALNAANREIMEAEKRVFGPDHVAEEEGPSIALVRRALVRAESFKTERLVAGAEASAKSLEERTEPELRVLLEDVARSITAALPPRTGFMLTASPMGTHGVAQYVGNVTRECAASWMEETVARFRAGPVSGAVVPRVEPDFGALGLGVAFGARAARRRHGRK